MPLPVASRSTNSTLLQRPVSAPFPSARLHTAATVLCAMTVTAANAATSDAIAHSQSTPLAATPARIDLMADDATTRTDQTQMLEFHLDDQE
jgi:hypothetical protein